MPLSASQKKQLGNEHGPFSKANLSFETAILKTGHMEFVLVYVDLNPLTYDIVKANLKHFEENKIVELLIDSAQLQKDGSYRTDAFQKELTEPAIAEQAHAVLASCQDAVIAMHQFTMGILSIKE